MTDRGGGISTTDGITFTIHYSDGTSVDVKDGVLFAQNGSGAMNVHVGVDEKWQLFGVYLSFFELLARVNLLADFDEYITLAAKEMRSARMEMEKNAGAAKGNIVRGIWDE